LGVIDYFSAQLRKLGVRIELGKEATALEVLAERPDVVVVATGSVAVTGNISGADRPAVILAPDVISGKRETGARVVIVGGGQTGLETAELLALKGKQVTVLEMLSEVGSDMEFITKVFMIPRLLQLGIVMRPNLRVEAITEKGVQAAGELFPADTVVLSVGLRSKDGLAEALKGRVRDVYTIGDCVKPRKLLDAIHEGAQAARAI